MKKDSKSDCDDDVQASALGLASASDKKKPFCTTVKALGEKPPLKK